MQVNEASYWSFDIVNQAPERMKIFSQLVVQRTKGYWNEKLFNFLKLFFEKLKVVVIENLVKWHISNDKKIAILVKIPVEMC